MAITQHPPPPDITRAGKDVEKLEGLCPGGGNTKWCSRYGKQCGSSSKKKKKEQNGHMIQQSHFQVHVQKPAGRASKRRWYTRVHDNVIHNSEKRKQPTQPPTGEGINTEWQTRTMGRSSVLGRKEIPTRATTWLRLEDPLPSEISQPQEDKPCPIPLG